MPRYHKVTLMAEHAGQQVCKKQPSSAHTLRLSHVSMRPLPSWQVTTRAEKGLNEPAVCMHSVAATKSQACIMLLLR